MNESPVSRPRRVYYILLLVLLVLLVSPASGQIELSVEPAMTKGPAGAPVTIVEFSDYQ